jgi:hypothetical protein
MRDTHFQGEHQHGGHCALGNIVDSDLHMMLHNTHKDLCQKCTSPSLQARDIQHTLSMDGNIY